MRDKMLLTVVEAAQQLGISRSLVYILLMRGDLRGVRLGRCRRIPFAELDRYVSRLVDEGARHAPSPRAQPPQPGPDATSGALRGLEVFTA